MKLDKYLRENRIDEASEKEVMINFLNSLKKVLINYGVKPYFDDGSLFMEVGKYSVGFNDREGYPLNVKTIDKFVKDFKKEK